MRVTNLPFCAGDARDTGWIPGSGRALEEEMKTHSNIPAWKIPWIEKPGGPSTWGHRGSDTTKHAHTLSARSLGSFPVSLTLC